MDKNIKIILRYDGTRYDGWQKQGNTDQTVQGKLEAVLEKMAGCPMEVHGSGRTDAGVHALAQVANFHLPESFYIRVEKADAGKAAARQAAVGKVTAGKTAGKTATEKAAIGKAAAGEAAAGKVAAGEVAVGKAAAGKAAAEITSTMVTPVRPQTLTEIKDYLNRYLPEDIAVTEIQAVQPRFHSRLNAVSKTYIYRIETAPKKDVFERKYVYGLGRPLDLAAMQWAAGILTGTHDFKAFCSLKKMKKSTVRTLTKLTVEQEGTKVLLTFEGNGFLHNMARILTGTLIEVGLHERTTESVAEALEAGDRALAGKTAPAEGLFLAEVSY